MKKFLAIAVCAAVLLTGWLVYGNKTVGLTELSFESDKLEKEFDGFRITQISDLHNAVFGKNNSRLLKVVEKSRPDIIVITGDLVDSRRTNLDVAIDFANQISKIAPCYYVTGNHEHRIDEFKKLKKNLKEIGVTVLDEKSVKIKRGKSSINLSGINDPSFFGDGYLSSDAGVCAAELEGLFKKDEFNVLLSHRPELFEVYVQSGADLVFCGHAHGGQVRLPLVGGLIAPNQGLFPKYDAGVFSEKATTMIVSRGIGNSLAPVRVNDRPEVVCVELQSEKQAQSS